MMFKHFGEVDSANLEEFYDAEWSFDGHEVELELCLDDKPAEDILRRLAELSNESERLVKRALDALALNYDQEDGEMQFYATHHLEELPGETIEILFGSRDVSKAVFLSKLVLQRVAFYSEFDDAAVVIDVGLDPDVTNYLLTVTFDRAGAISDIAMES